MSGSTPRLLTLLLAAAIAVTATSCTGVDGPAPDRTSEPPAASSAAPPALTTESLPETDELRLFDESVWTERKDAKVADFGYEISRCWQEQPTDALDTLPTAVMGQYIGPDDIGEIVAMFDFASPEAADAGWSWFVEQVDGCVAKLESEEMASPGAGKWVEVPIDGAQARYRVIEGQTGDDKRFWESHGLVRVGNRIGVVLFTMSGTEYTFNDQEGQEPDRPLNPLWEHLPPVGSRLA